MTLYDYHTSQEIAAEGYPFYALVMAAMRKADDSNLRRLRVAFPELWAELLDRYNAPGGELPSDSSAIDSDFQSQMDKLVP